MLSGEAVPAFKWGEPDEEALVEFLVVEKNFNEDRVRTALKKLKGTKGKSSQGGRDLQVNLMHSMTLEHGNIHHVLVSISSSGKLRMRIFSCTVRISRDCSS